MHSARCRIIPRATSPLPTLYATCDIVSNTYTHFRMRARARNHSRSTYISYMYEYIRFFSLVLSPFPFPPFLSCRPLSRWLLPRSYLSFVSESIVLHARSVTTYVAVCAVTRVIPIHALYSLCVRSIETMRWARMDEKTSANSRMNRVPALQVFRVRAIAGS